LVAFSSFKHFILLTPCHRQWRWPSVQHSDRHHKPPSSIAQSPLP
jgi:hypothetical protein